jgi:hypothetical protein
MATGEMEIGQGVGASHRRRYKGNGRIDKAGAAVAHIPFSERRGIEPSLSGIGPVA